MADWEEIKRLAADFQRTQTSDTLQRISERNCIDIVKKLTELSLIELIYTCDGKEFLTPEHLLKEIEDEIYVNGGRVHLHDLSSNLNVDYQHVENKAKDLARDRPDEYNLVLGQVIHSTYKRTLGKQIYDTMITIGQLSIADFAKSLDLPSEFLLTLVKELLPHVVDEYVASPDERTYYTTDMMERYKSIIAGTLSAITKPTTIASIMKKIDITERMFNPIVEGLIKGGRLDATIENRLYIPSIYAREQNEWIEKFYTTNSYIDYDILIRKGIKQPKAFLKKRFPDGIHLKNCLVSPDLVSQVESMIEDCVASNSLMDVSTIVPSSLQSDDVELMLRGIFSKNKQLDSNCVVLHQTSICSLGYIATCKDSFSNLMLDKAKEDLKQGKLVKYFLGSDPAKSQQSGSLSENRDEVQHEDCAKLDQPEEDCNAGGRDDERDKDIGTVKVAEASSKVEQTDIEIETTFDERKQERKQKKSKQKVDDESTVGNKESDDEHSVKKSKGGSARKSGGGGQGREIKQRSTKRKYNPSKNKQIYENSDDENNKQQASKTPRSSKGRAAKRGVSPSMLNQPITSGTDISGGSRQSKTSDSAGVKKEPLEFMSTKELVAKLRNESRNVEEFSEEVLESIAIMMVDELNKNYAILSRRVLEEHLCSSGESTVE